jgi:high-affinity Fe2+/Pb2+ permease
MINPVSWSRERQIALLIVALIGAALGTVLGYFVYAVGWGEGALSRARASGVS